MSNHDSRGAQRVVLLVQVNHMPLAVSLLIVLIVLIVLVVLVVLVVSFVGERGLP